MGGQGPRGEPGLVVSQFHFTLCVARRRILVFTIRVILFSLLYWVLTKTVAPRLTSIPVNMTRGPFHENPDNCSGPESCFMCAMFALKTQIVLGLKAGQ